MKTQRSIALSLTLALITLAALACGSKAGNSTPTETFKTYYNAVKNADVAALKSIMPKAELEKTEKEATGKGSNLDDALKERLKRLSTLMPAATPETRDEKIDGNNATLEIKDGENWHKINFVKEDDGWKMSR